MKRIVIILAVALASLISPEAQAQTKEFKEFMEICMKASANYSNSDVKFEITQLSGAVIQQLMPKAIKDKKGVENRINSIFQVVMSEQVSGYFRRANNLAINGNKYNHHMTMTLKGTEYKIFVAKLGSGVFEYLFLINNGKDYCVCDIVGVLSTPEIMSFIGVKNDGEKITGDKKDSVEVIQP